MHKDLLYEKEINALIPMAEKEARAKVNYIGVRSEPRDGYNHCFFTEYFHRAMIRLAIENGLRSF